MRYTHFALLRCCIHLNGLFLLCNSYYIKLAVESPVSFCCYSAEVFIKLFSPKQFICSQSSSCRIPQTALHFIILLGNLEKKKHTFIRLGFMCYHFVKTNFGFPRSVIFAREFKIIVFIYLCFFFKKETDAHCKPE